MRSRLRWEAGLEGVAGSYICSDKAAASAHARWLCVGDLVVEPELHVVLLQLRRGALVTVQQQGLVQAEVTMWCKRLICEVVQSRRRPLPGPSLG